MKGFWPLLVGLFLLSGCDHGPSPDTDQPIPSRDNHVVNITHPQAGRLLYENKENPNFVIIDLRTPEEYATGHLKDAKLINFYSPGFQKIIGQLDRHRQYLIYCHSGNRSGKAAKIMSRMGFQKVFNMQRGMSWGFPQPPELPKERLKHPGSMSLIGN